MKTMTQSNHIRMLIRGFETLVTLHKQSDAVPSDDDNRIINAALHAAKELRRDEQKPAQDETQYTAEPFDEHLCGVKR